MAQKFGLHNPDPNFVRNMGIATMLWSIQEKFPTLTDEQLTRIAAQAINESNLSFVVSQNELIEIWSRLGKLVPDWERLDGALKEAIREPRRDGG